MKFRFSQLALLTLVCLTLVGCRKEDPQPELKDPIYKDLNTRAGDYEKAVTEGQTQVKDLRLAIEKTEANTIEFKNVQRDLAKAEKKLLGDEQLARYYKIRAERRKFMGRRAYREAFAAGREWPDPSEYSDYLVNMRLREVSMNWNKRVPKLQDRIPAAKTDKKAEPKAE
jgi:hypothetical protein